MKKSVSIIVLLALFISLLSACGTVDTNGSGNSDSQSDVTYNDSSNETDNNSNFSHKVDIVGVWYSTGSDCDSREEAVSEYDSLDAVDYSCLDCYIFMSNGYCIGDGLIDAAAYINPDNPTLEQLCSYWNYDCGNEQEDDSFYDYYESFEDAYSQGFIQKYNYNNDKITVSYSGYYGDFSETLDYIYTAEGEYLMLDDEYYFRGSGFCNPNYDSQSDYTALIGNWIAEECDYDDNEKFMVNFRENLNGLINGEECYWSLIDNQLTIDDGWGWDTYHVYQINLNTLLLFDDDYNTPHDYVYFRQ